ncbi:protein NUCLEAR FUSION DEFECTIVE 4-like [Juglans microcarpa x Juglans regia]|uniref:protein NUCLEAR FUSION DEFECTIVE 4-like n=1 Tax=Juglans microcarpa x Juglans regia TaxID=2249226 RepID=UPI001B7E9C65|nr:protein NUCLEAR FUSION DEFECTIVE 4-like [Juglans microcarpa x Juglans regia]
MKAQSRKWMILVSTIWIQAFTGTNFDFSAYSSALKSVLGISQVQLNYLAVASDLGKAFGWSSGLALKYFPAWVVMFMAAFMGLAGYGIQWLVITSIITLPYFLVFLLCLLAGCSICWFNTVCFVLCNQNFPSNRPLAISLTVSFNGVSAAFYTLAATAIDPSSDSIYLLLNALIPLLTSIASLIPILSQPSLDPLSPDEVHRDSLLFLFLNLLAVITGIYVVFSPSNSDTTTARLLFSGAIALLVVPLCIPGVVCAKDWFHRSFHSFRLQAGSGFILVDAEDLEIHKELLSRHAGSIGSVGQGSFHHSSENGAVNGINDQKLAGEIEGCGCWQRTIAKDQLAMLGEEHPARIVVRRLDFWLYYLAYFCGGTIGLVYSNNLGQIAQSLGQGSETTTLLTLYSSFSFFGRLLSAAPDYIRAKFYFARTGWLTIALLPTPIAFLLLAASGSGLALRVGTSLVALSSGFIFAAAVSITSELFGPNSVGVNHNILITNIPIGSLVYGCVAAVVYDANTSSESAVCMGRQCYFLTFVWWGCMSVLGLACSVLLFLRTRDAYNHFEQNRMSTQLY